MTKMTFYSSTKSHRHYNLTLNCFSVQVAGAFQSKTLTMLFAAGSGNQGLKHSQLAVSLQAVNKHQLFVFQLLVTRYSSFSETSRPAAPSCLHSYASTQLPERSLRLCQTGQLDYIAVCPSARVRKFQILHLIASNICTISTS